MNRLIIVILLSLTFNITNIKDSHAVGAGIFKSIFKLFGKNADEATGVIKQGDEVINGSKAKNVELPTGAIAEEGAIISKIGDDIHQGHYNSSKKDSVGTIIARHGIKFKKVGKEILDNSDNIYELFTNGASNEQKKFYSFVIANWVGKIYRFSNYFNNPEYENRNLLVCKNHKEIFYFTILMDNEDDINRALLTEHKFLDSSEKTLPQQELLIIRDDAHVKIMSVKPTKEKNSINFFTIYDNQHFIHNSEENIEIIIKNADSKPTYVARNSKCYKASKEGLMIASIK